MAITTKGKYALLFLVDLAKYGDFGFITLKDVSKRISVSKKYLEQIVPLLSKAGFLTSTRGFQGGYKLNLPASKINVYDVLNSVENSFMFEFGAVPPALNFVFDGLNETIKQYLSKITIQNLLENENSTYDYII